MSSAATARAIPQMIREALGGRPPVIHGAGDVERDYIFLDDVCRATAQAALREVSGVFNIGRGEGVSIARLAEEIVRLSGAPFGPKRVPAELDAQAAASMVFDIEKMRSIIGYEPQVPLEEGLQRTIEHCRKEG